MSDRKADQPDCSKCGHASVLHNGPNLLCAAVFRGAWGPCTCPGYALPATPPASETVDAAREALPTDAITARLTEIAASMVRGTHVCEKPHRNGEANPHIHFDDAYIATARELSNMARGIRHFAAERDALIAAAVDEARAAALDEARAAMMRHFGPIYEEVIDAAIDALRNKNAT